MKTLYPVYRPEFADKFVDPTLIAPWLIPGQPKGGLTTSALKFNTKLDLIGISQKTPDDTPVTGMIDPNVSLNCIFYRQKGDHRVHHYFFVDDKGDTEPQVSFALLAASGYKEVKLNFTFEYAIAGKIGVLEIGSVTVKNAITGVLNLESGDLSVVTENNGDVEMLGYVLNASISDNIIQKHSGCNEDMMDEIEPVFIPTNMVTMHDIPDLKTPTIISATDEKGSGGAYHRYEISGLQAKRSGSVTDLPPQVIEFQKGPVPEFGHNGVTMEHLLAIAGHRLQCFQAGPFASDDNDEALYHIECAIEALNRRTMARIARGVEGKEVV